jgi:UDPglucose--hexose-1-phosphate uridylyltransferase
VTDHAPHRRFNPMTGEWVLVSPHRMHRPWAGAVEAPPPLPAAFDAACPLCPGVVRANGVTNPAYTGPFVFDNDFPALLPVSARSAKDDLLLKAEPETGVCRVLCYDPDHSMTLARMSAQQGAGVVRAWIVESAALAAQQGIGAVTVFENRGAMMGASNPHPHGQIWATSAIPSTLATEQRQLRAWRLAHGRALLPAYLAREQAEGVRVLFATAHWTAMIPFWAAWPFETLILPHRDVACLAELTAQEAEDLGGVLVRLFAGCDRLFDCPFPYTMGVHQAGFDGGDWTGFTLHLHVFPPLLRSASVRKHMVGFEMLAMAQRDLTPEAAAARLRALV